MASSSFLMVFESARPAQQVWYGALPQRVVDASHAIAKFLRCYTATKSQLNHELHCCLKLNID